MVFLQVKSNNETILHGWARSGHYPDLVNILKYKYKLNPERLRELDAKLYVSGRDAYGRFRNLGTYWFIKHSTSN